MFEPRVVRACESCEANPLCGSGLASVTKPPPWALRIQRMPSCRVGSPLQGLKPSFSGTQGVALGYVRSGLRPSRDNGLRLDRSALIHSIIWPWALWSERILSCLHQAWRSGCFISPNGVLYWNPGYCVCRQ